MKDILNTDEAAEYFGCEPSQIRRLITSKKLPAFSIGVGKHKCYRIRREAIDEFIRSQEALALPGPTVESTIDPEPKRRSRGPAAVDDEIARSLTAKILQMSKGAS